MAQRKACGANSVTRGFTLDDSSSCAPNNFRVRSPAIMVKNFTALSQKRLWIRWRQWTTWLLAKSFVIVVIRMTAGKRINVISTKTNDSTCRRFTHDRDFFQFLSLTATQVTNRLNDWSQRHTPWHAAIDLSSDVTKQRCHRPPRGNGQKTFVCHRRVKTSRYGTAVVHVHTKDSAVGWNERWGWWSESHRLINWATAFDCQNRREMAAHARADRHTDRTADDGSLPNALAATKNRFSALVRRLRIAAGAQSCTRMTSRMTYEAEWRLIIDGKVPVRNRSFFARTTQRPSVRTFAPYVRRLLVSLNPRVNCIGSASRCSSRQPAPAAFDGARSRATRQWSNANGTPSISVEMHSTPDGGTVDEVRYDKIKAICRLHANDLIIILRERISSSVSSHHRYVYISNISMSMRHTDQLLRRNNMQRIEGSSLFTSAYKILDIINRPVVETIFTISSNKPGRQTDAGWGEWSDLSIFLNSCHLGKAGHLFR